MKVSRSRRMVSPASSRLLVKYKARRDTTTTLAQTSVGGHHEIGAVERATVLPGRARTYEKMRIIPGTQLFPWMLRHSVWAVVRYQSDQRTKQTPDLEQAHKFYSSIRTMKSPEPIHASRMVEINKWRERGVVERWSRQAAMAAGGQMFNARCMDEQHKEKSRYVVKDFANT